MSLRARVHLTGAVIAVVTFCLVLVVDAKAQTTTPTPESAAPITSEHATDWLWQGFEDVGVPLVLAAGLAGVFSLFRRASEA